VSAKEQLLDRRQGLVTAITSTGTSASLTRLLDEVDSALERVEAGTYGICEVCKDPIEEDRLCVDPIIRYCLDHLTDRQQRALEHDLETAVRVQTAMLPKRDVSFAGWEVHYRYEPAGPVSGDYIDLVSGGRDSTDLFFVIGDVSGKGVSASILMGHLHAMFRTLVDMEMGVQDLMRRANQVFCESTLTSQYATLVCGRATATGEVELCNAGHCTPLLLRGDEVRRLETTALPLGMFCDTSYNTERVTLHAGDTLVLYTDGLSEASGDSGSEYGLERLSRLLSENRELPVDDLAGACLDDVAELVGEAPRNDDLTLILMRRAQS